MLDFVPLARPWRVVGDRDRETSLIGKLLQFQLEEPAAAGIAASTVSGDIQMMRTTVRLPSHTTPPTSDRLHGKFRCVFVDADGDESIVLRDVDRKSTRLNSSHMS